MFKLVRESITRFEQRTNPYDKFGIGKSVKIRAWLDEMDMEDYIINDDLTININKIDFPWRTEMKQLPDFINFNAANSVNLKYRHDLENLRGMPKKVKKDFDCSMNNLISLEGAPEWVGGDFICYDNPGKFKVKDVEAICDVDGEIRTLSPDQETKQRYNKTYRERGPLSQRTSHKYRNEYGYTHHSKGYKLYFVLKFIKDSEPEGLRHIDIIKFAFEFSYGKDSFDNPTPYQEILARVKKAHPGLTNKEASQYASREKNPNRGYWSYAMGRGIGSVGFKIEKNKYGRYILNYSGHEYLKKYKDIFDK